MNQDLYNGIFKGLPDLLTVEDMSNVLGISTKTCYQLLKERHIKSIKVGRFFRIPKLRLMEYLGLIAG